LGGDHLAQPDRNRLGRRHLASLSVYDGAEAGMFTALCRKVAIHSMAKPCRASLVTRNAANSPGLTERLAQNRDCR
ncbi:hypothetical protein OMR07_16050, partial [Methylobacterium organophilum]|nr:hypothetical protein [Methylobacterium organophilum]